MAFCNMCGTQIPDGTTTCVPCSGAAASAIPASPAPVAAGAGLQDNVAGMLAYITIVPAIIFLVMEPYNRNRFIRFHSFQSIFFAVAWTAMWIVLGIIAHIPFLGWMTIFLWPLVVLAAFCVWVLLLIKANAGQMYKLPFIGDLAEKQG
jgi:uncharacterized membrane protein